MLEQQCRLYRFNLAVLETMTADITDDELTHQPAPGTNPPIWILGHLAVATDYASKTLGIPTACPKAWHVDFGPGSTPLKMHDPAPTKDQLLEAIRNGHARVTAATANVTPELLAAPHPVALLKGTPIETVGDLLTHLMNTHEAMHIGQLSMWRRLTGRKPLI
ncbi:MAG: DinB family protein [Planctomycetaceae bacterium]|nr:DinB family protein [Planctomycetaceae bacterium]